MVREKYLGARCANGHNVRYVDTDECTICAEVEAGLMRIRERDAAPKQPYKGRNFTWRRAL